MNIFQDEHIEILKLLLKNQVDFLLVGGYAVIHYGYRRTTGDMDIWVRPDNLVNKQKLCTTLKEAGFEPEDVDYLRNLNFNTTIVFCIGDEPIKIDFMTKVNLVSFNDAWEHKVFTEIDNLVIPVLHYNDLILTKINTGRAKDLADIEELQKIKKQA